MQPIWETYSSFVGFNNCMRGSRKFCHEKVPQILILQCCTYLCIYVKVAYQIIYCLNKPLSSARWHFVKTDLYDSKIMDTYVILDYKLPQTVM